MNIPAAGHFGVLKGEHMGRRKKNDIIKRQFSLRSATLAALQEDYAAHGRQTCPDLSSFVDAILGISLGAERRRHVRYHRQGVRARELLFRQRDRAERNLWRVRHQAAIHDKQLDVAREQLREITRGMTRDEVVARRDADPGFRLAQDLLALAEDMQTLRVSDNKSVSISLRLLLKHLINGVGTDTLPEGYASEVRAQYDCLCARRAVPSEEDGAWAGAAEPGETTGEGVL
jgi:hypothetical protein